MKIGEFLSEIWDTPNAKGFFELRPISLDQHPQPMFFDAANGVDPVVKKIEQLERGRNSNIYFGVIPRDDRRGKAENSIKPYKILYQDLDETYQTLSDADVKTKGEALTKILYDRYKIPKPSIMVRSGKGIHFYWLLDDGMDAITWRSVQNYIYYVMINEGYFADEKVRLDPARILRPPETTNHKYGIRTCVLNPIKGKSARYSSDNFKHLQKDFLRVEKCFNLMNTRSIKIDTKRIDELKKELVKTIKDNNIWVPGNRWDTLWTLSGYFAKAQVDEEVMKDIYRLIEAECGHAYDSGRENEISRTYNRVKQGEAVVSLYSRASDPQNTWAKKILDVLEKYKNSSYMSQDAHFVVTAKTVDPSGNYFENYYILEKNGLIWTKRIDTTRDKDTNKTSQFTSFEKQLTYNPVKELYIEKSKIFPDDTGIISANVEVHGSPKHVKEMDNILNNLSSSKSNEYRTVSSALGFIVEHLRRKGIIQIRKTYPVEGFFYDNEIDKIIFNGPKKSYDKDGLVKSLKALERLSHHFNDQRKFWGILYCLLVTPFSSVRKQFHKESYGVLLHGHSNCGKSTLVDVLGGGMYREYMKTYGGEAIGTGKRMSSVVEKSTFPVCANECEMIFQSGKMNDLIKNIMGQDFFCRQAFYTKDEATESYAYSTLIMTVNTMPQNVEKAIQRRLIPFLFTRSDEISNSQERNHAQTLQEIRTELWPIGEALKELCGELDIAEDLKKATNRDYVNLGKKIFERIYELNGIKFNAPEAKADEDFNSMDEEEYFRTRFREKIIYCYREMLRRMNDDQERSFFHGLMSSDNKSDKCRELMCYLSPYLPTYIELAKRADKIYITSSVTDIFNLPGALTRVSEALGLDAPTNNKGSKGRSIKAGYEFIWDILKDEISSNLDVDAEDDESELLVQNKKTASAA